MWERLNERDFYGGYDETRNMWNDMTVNLLGDLYEVYGFDAAELDYYKRSGI